MSDTTFHEPAVDPLIDQRIAHPVNVSFTGRAATCRLDPSFKRAGQLVLTQRGRLHPLSRKRFFPPLQDSVWACWNGRRAA